MSAKSSKSKKESKPASKKTKPKEDKDASKKTSTDTPADQKDTQTDGSSEPTIVIPDSSPVISGTANADQEATAENKDTEKSEENATPPSEPSADSAQTPPVIKPVNDATTITPMEEAVDQPAPDIIDNQDFVDEKSGGGKKLFIVFFVALLIGGGAVAGFFYFLNPYSQTEDTAKDEMAEEMPAESPTPVVDEEEATASATLEEADLSQLSVQILNGSGIPGEAGVVRNLLAGAGFVTFEVGNAASYDYTSTEVQLKDGTPASVFKTIQEALSAEGYSVTEDTNALSEESTYDVVIVVGSK